MNATPSLDGRTLLVVDDSADTLELLDVILTMSGATGVTASSATAGLQEFERHHPDAVVSDLAMPNEDGFWLVHRLREALRAAGRHVPVLALTAHRSRYSASEVLGAGFDAMLLKPIDPHDLCHAIAALLQA